ncbi:MAG TPA: polysaccharide deacetylase family protein [Streptosporangiaceae bacterium]
MAALGSFAAGCGGSTAAPETAPAPGSPAPPVRAAGAAPGPAADADLIRHRYRGLRPFAPPPAPPAVKPITLSRSDPTVFSRVPMTDRVVFVTIDDGIEKDPNFIQMVKDFQVPITISLADTLIRDDYAYFEKLYETGYVSIQNHTVTHPLDMPALTAARQLDEVAGQQGKLHREYGVMPYISGRRAATTTRRRSPRSAGPVSGA